MIFSYKAQPRDFFVKELLPPNVPSGHGGFFYVSIQKQNLTTQELVMLISKGLDINKKQISIAGLKDKLAITQQRISIPKTILSNAGGINALTRVLQLSKRAKVLEISAHTEPLSISMNQGNHFEIFLRSIRKIHPSEFYKICEQGCSQLLSVPIPNTFGEQRFGKTGNNRLTGKKLLLGQLTSLKHDRDTPAERGFKLQALSSYLFNAYVKLRMQKKILMTPLPGDIIRNTQTKKHETLLNVKTFDPTIHQITGPVYGNDLLQAPKVESSGITAFELEQEVLKNNGLKASDLVRFGQYKVRGIRRPLTVQPINFKHKAVPGGAYRLTFNLPSGCYATTVLDVLSQLLEKRKE